MGERIPAIIRFSSKYKIDESTGCWQWTGAVLHDGYGMFRNENQKNQKAHRWSYEHYNGPIGPGMSVCHRCDNPSCVNPSHLWLGTHLENEQDKDKKNRRRGAAKGEANHRAVLTTDNVIDIRLRFKNSETMESIAKLYKVSPTTISKIVKNKTWKDI